jgi:ribosomal-protein-alanine N-acetyltransferase
MNNITLRRMTSADIPQVSAIENNVFTLPWSAQSISDQVVNDNDHSIVACFKDEVVGYAIVWHTADEAELGNIAIAAPFRRMGAARQLMQAVTDEAAVSGIKTIFLEARVGNVAAIKLYEGFGFVSYNTRKGLYVQPDEDGILMKKDMMA